jgi:hypothetical protein
VAEGVCDLLEARTFAAHPHRVLRSFAALISPITGSSGIRADGTALTAELVGDDWL